MDALTFLRADHESVLGMLEVLDGAPQGDGARESGLSTMVTNLVIAESQHEAVEEQLFWPAVRAALEDGDHLADHAIAQEEAGKTLLQLLEDGAPGEPEYHRALDEFVVVVREHIEYEENVVWPRFKSAVSAQQLEQLGDRLQTAKKIAPTRPHPNAPSGGLAQNTMGVAAAAVDQLRDRLSGRAADNPPDAPKS
ncbi:hemerythrin domain-containing protein [Mycolicibacter algericus]|uniref:Hemerythrin n=2 Tax=Mycolicibacter algericus TaxID=1288388 RepID=A0A7I9YCB3_MYCAL|nr:hemerythrin domain-containing protein [Mycolicibacter algericus]OQZ99683.1 hemerythrin [Mycolicibacter algericus DSM 45454]GFG86182.1 hemerythrin [Mycolicibacter algericus]